MTADGSHVRHFAFMLDQCLPALSLPFPFVERLGRMPSQLSFVVTALLEKPQGGYRPIGVFVGRYRLWMKFRRGPCL